MQPADLERIIVDKRFVIVVAVLLAVSLLILSGCTPEPQVVIQEVTVEVPVTVIVQAPTLEPLPTYTPYPTYTAVPEPTATPTATQTPTPEATATPELTANELDERLAAQPLSVVRTRYIVQHQTAKRLYPDILSAEVRNNSEENIRDYAVVFMAWDANGLPILLKGHIDFSSGEYVKAANFPGANIIPGGEAGHGWGLGIAENLNIESFAAVVKSFTTFDDEEWENPYLDAWRAMYEGRPRTE